MTKPSRIPETSNHITSPNISSEVTVVIPCYNQEHWLSDAVESCLKQTIPCAIIVVDDGSTVPVTNKWDNVTLIRQENRGLSGARNTGIRACKTKYFLTLDADDCIHKDFIKKTIGVDDIVSTWQQEFGDSNTLWKQTNMFPVYEDFIDNNQINCCALTEKKVFDTIGGYDERIKRGLEDWNFWIRATRAGFEVTVIQEALFFYRKHGRSMITDVEENFKEIRDNMFSFL